MSVLRRIVRFELDLYLAVTRWITRRPHVPAGSTAWGYSRMVTPVMWLWILACAIEVPLVHVLTPWPSVRIGGLAVSVWGLAWMIGMLASLKVYPHLTDREGLRVRHGKRADVHIPWAAVASVTTVDRDLPSSLRTFQPLETDAGIDLQIGVSARANVHAVLTEPRAVSTPKGPVTISALTFLVDEPREYAAAARRAIELRRTERA